MALEGIHHVTAITGDAPRNVDFYARVLGLRLVKQTVNQDDPTVYHLFYADEDGDPGADLTFFEYPGAAPGQAGAGMVHTVAFRVAGAESLDFWAERLAGEGVAVERAPDGLRFSDPEGMGLALVVNDVPDRPLVARSAEVPDEHALQGFDHVRAYTADPAASVPLLRDGLGMRPVDGDETVWEARGEQRGGRIVYEPATGRGIQGAGTVHHVAWAVTGEAEQDDVRGAVKRAGAHPTPVIDRYYFKSVYFREPSGVLFELATMGPGFDVDEPAATMGDHLALPPKFEPLRERLQGVLTPLPDTRAWRRAASSSGMTLPRP
jgi:glyoxalase family protein